MSQNESLNPDPSSQEPAAPLPGDSASDQSAKDHLKQDNNDARREPPSPKAIAGIVSALIALGAMWAVVIGWDNSGNPDPKPVVENPAPHGEPKKKPPGLVDQETVPDSDLELPMSETAEKQTPTKPVTPSAALEAHRDDFAQLLRPSNQAVVPFAHRLKTLEVERQILDYLHQPEHAAIEAEIQWLFETLALSQEAPKIWEFAQTFKAPGGLEQLKNLCQKQTKDREGAKDDVDTLIARLSVSSDRTLLKELAKQISPRTAAQVAESALGENERLLLAAVAKGQDLDEEPLPTDADSQRLYRVLGHLALIQIKRPNPMTSVLALQVATLAGGLPDDQLTETELYELIRNDETELQEQVFERIAESWQANWGDDKAAILKLCREQASKEPGTFHLKSFCEAVNTDAGSAVPPADQELVLFLGQSAWLSLEACRTGRFTRLLSSPPPFEPLLGQPLTSALRTIHLRLGISPEDSVVKTIEQELEADPNLGQGWQQRLKTGDPLSAGQSTGAKIYSFLLEFRGTLESEHNRIEVTRKKLFGDQANLTEAILHRALKLADEDPLSTELARLHNQKGELFVCEIPAQAPPDTSAKKSPEVPAKKIPLRDALRNWIAERKLRSLEAALAADLLKAKSPRSLEEALARYPALAVSLPVQDQESEAAYRKRLSDWQDVSNLKNVLQRTALYADDWQLRPIDEFCLPLGRPGGSDSKRLQTSAGLSAGFELCAVLGHNPLKPEPPEEMTEDNGKPRKVQRESRSTGLFLRGRVLTILPGSDEAPRKVLLTNLNFLDPAQEPNAAANDEEWQKYPDAETALRQLMETALLESGFSLAEAEARAAVLPQRIQFGPAVWPEGQTADTQSAAKKTLELSWSHPVADAKVSPFITAELRFSSKATEFHINQKPLLAPDLVLALASRQHQWLETQEAGEHAWKTLRARPTVLAKLLSGLDSVQVVFRNNRPVLIVKTGPQEIQWPLATSADGRVLFPDGPIPDDLVGALVGPLNQAFAISQDFAAKARQLLMVKDQRLLIRFEIPGLHPNALQYLSTDWMQVAFADEDHQGLQFLREPGAPPFAHPVEFSNGLFLSARFHGVGVEAEKGRLVFHLHWESPAEIPLGRLLVDYRNGPLKFDFKVSKEALANLKPYITEKLAAWMRLKDPGLQHLQNGVELPVVWASEEWSFDLNNGLVIPAITALKVGDKEISLTVKLAYDGRQLSVNGLDVTSLIQELNPLLDEHQKQFDEKLASLLKGPHALGLGDWGQLTFEPAGRMPSLEELRRGKITLLGQGRLTVRDLAMDVLIEQCEFDLKQKDFAKQLQRQSLKWRIKTPEALKKLMQVPPGLAEAAKFLNLKLTNVSIAGENWTIEATARPFEFQEEIPFTLSANTNTLVADVRNGLIRELASRLAGQTWTLPGNLADIRFEQTTSEQKSEGLLCRFNLAIQLHQPAPVLIEVRNLELREQDGTLDWSRPSGKDVQVSGFSKRAFKESLLEHLEKMSSLPVEFANFEIQWDDVDSTFDWKTFTPVLKGTLKYNPPPHEAEEDAEAEGRLDIADEIRDPDKIVKALFPAEGLKFTLSRRGLSVDLDELLKNIAKRQIERFGDELLAQIMGWLNRSLHGATRELLFAKRDLAALEARFARGQLALGEEGVLQLRLVDVSKAEFSPASIVHPEGRVEIRFEPEKLALETEADYQERLKTLKQEGKQYGIESNLELLLPGGYRVLLTGAPLPPKDKVFTKSKTEEKPEEKPPAPCCRIDAEGFHLRNPHLTLLGPNGPLPRSLAELPKEFLPDALEKLEWLNRLPIRLEAPESQTLNEHQAATWKAFDPRELSLSVKVSVHPPSLLKALKDEPRPEEIPKEEFVPLLVVKFEKGQFQVQETLDEQQLLGSLLPKLKLEELDLGVLKLKNLEPVFEGGFLSYSGEIIQFFPALAESEFRQALDPPLKFSGLRVGLSGPDFSEFRIPEADLRKAVQKLTEPLQRKLGISGWAQNGTVELLDPIQLSPERVRFGLALHLTLMDRPIDVTLEEIELAWIERKLQVRFKGANLEGLEAIAEPILAELRNEVQERLEKINPVSFQGVTLVFGELSTDIKADKLSLKICGTLECPGWLPRTPWCATLSADGSLKFDGLKIAAEQGKQFLIDKVREFVSKQDGDWAKLRLGNVIVEPRLQTQLETWKLSDPVEVGIFITTPTSPHELQIPGLKPIPLGENGMRVASLRLDVLSGQADFQPKFDKDLFKEFLESTLTEIEEAIQGINHPFKDPLEITLLGQTVELKAKRDGNRIVAEICATHFDGNLKRPVSETDPNRILRLKNLELASFSVGPPPQVSLGQLKMNAVQLENPHVLAEWLVRMLRLNDHLQFTHVEIRQGQLVLSGSLAIPDLDIHTSFQQLSIPLDASKQTLLASLGNVLLSEIENQTIAFGEEQKLTIGNFRVAVTSSSFSVSADLTLQVLEKPVSIQVPGTLTLGEGGVKLKFQDAKAIFQSAVAGLLKSGMNELGDLLGEATGLTLKDMQPIYHREIPVGFSTGGGVSLSILGGPFDGLSLGFDNLVVNQSGLKLPTKWSLTIPITISVPPIDIFEPGGAFDTRSQDLDLSVKLGVTSAAATKYLIFFRNTLTLPLKSVHRLETEGQLILFKVVPLATVKGEVDFSQGHIIVDFFTNPSFRKILEIKGHVALYCKLARFEGNLSVKVLQCEVAKAEILLDFSRGEIRIAGLVNLLFIRVEAAFTVAKGFSNPQLHAKASLGIGKLDLVWIEIDFNRRRIKTRAGIAFVSVTITFPSPWHVDTGMIEQQLLNLLNPANWAKALLSLLSGNTNISFGSPPGPGGNGNGGEGGENGEEGGGGEDGKKGMALPPGAEPVPVPSLIKGPIACSFYNLNGARRLKVHHAGDDTVSGTDQVADVSADFSQYVQSPDFDAVEKSFVSLLPAPFTLKSIGIAPVEMGQTVTLVSLEVFGPEGSTPENPLTIVWAATAEIPIEQVPPYLLTREGQTPPVPPTPSPLPGPPPPVPPKETETPEIVGPPTPKPLVRGDFAWGAMWDVELIESGSYLWIFKNDPRGEFKDVRHELSAFPFLEDVRKNPEQTRTQLVQELWDHVLLGSETNANSQPPGISIFPAPFGVLIVRTPEFNNRNLPKGVYMLHSQRTPIPPPAPEEPPSNRLKTPRYVDSVKVSFLPIPENTLRMIREDWRETKIQTLSQRADALFWLHDYLVFKIFNEQNPWVGIWTVDAPGGKKTDKGQTYKPVQPFDTQAPPLLTLLLKESADGNIPVGAMIRSDLEAQIGPDRVNVVEEFLKNSPKDDYPFWVYDENGQLFAPFSKNLHNKSSQYKKSLLNPASVQEHSAFYRKLRGKRVDPLNRFDLDQTKWQGVFLDQRANQLVLVREKVENAVLVTDIEENAWTYPKDLAMFREEYPSLENFQPHLIGGDKPSLLLGVDQETVSRLMEPLRTGKKQDKAKNLGLFSYSAPVKEHKAGEKLPFPLWYVPKEATDTLRKSALFELSQDLSDYFKPTLFNVEELKKRPVLLQSLSEIKNRPEDPSLVPVHLRQAAPLRAWELILLATFGSGESRLVCFSEGPNALDEWNIQAFDISPDFKTVVESSSRDLSFQLVKRENAPPLLIVRLEDKGAKIWWDKQTSQPRRLPLWILGGDDPRELQPYESQEDPAAWSEWPKDRLFDPQFLVDNPSLLVAIRQQARLGPLAPLPIRLDMKEPEFPLERYLIGKNTGLASGRIVRLHKQGPDQPNAAKPTSDHAFALPDDLLNALSKYPSEHRLRFLDKAVAGRATLLATFEEDAVTRLVKELKEETSRYPLYVLSEAQGGRAPFLAHRMSHPDPDPLPVPLLPEHFKKTLFDLEELALRADWIDYFFRESDQSGLKPMSVKTEPPGNPPNGKASWQLILYRPAQASGKPGELMFARTAPVPNAANQAGKEAPLESYVLSCPRDLETWLALPETSEHSLDIRIERRTLKPQGTPVEVGMMWITDVQDADGKITHAANRGRYAYAELAKAGNYPLWLFEVPPNLPSVPQAPIAFRRVGLSVVHQDIEEPPKVLTPEILDRPGLLLNILKLHENSELLRLVHHDEGTKPQAWFTVLFQRPPPSALPPEAKAPQTGGRLLIHRDQVADATISPERTIGLRPEINFETCLASFEPNAPQEPLAQEFWATVRNLPDHEDIYWAGTPWDVSNQRGYPTGEEADQAASTEKGGFAFGPRPKGPNALLPLNGEFRLGFMEDNQHAVFLKGQVASIRTRYQEQGRGNVPEMFINRFPQNQTERLLSYEFHLELTQSTLRLREDKDLGAKSGWGVLPRNFYRTWQVEDYGRPGN